MADRIMPTDVALTGRRSFRRGGGEGDLDQRRGRDSGAQWQSAPVYGECDGRNFVSAIRGQSRQRIAMRAEDSMRRPAFVRWPTVGRQYFIGRFALGLDDFAMNIEPFSAEEDGFALQNRWQSLMPPFRRRQKRRRTKWAEPAEVEEELDRSAVVEGTGRPACLRRNGISRCVWPYLSQRGRS